MNIFDFENRLKSHTANAKGEVDMDRLLSDLNLTPAPKRSNRKLFLLFAAALLVSFSAVSYYMFNTSSSVPIVHTIQSDNTDATAEQSSNIINEKTIQEIGTATSKTSRIDNKVNQAQSTKSNNSTSKVISQLNPEIQSTQIEAKDLTPETEEYPTYNSVIIGEDNSQKRAPSPLPARDISILNTNIISAPLQNRESLNIIDREAQEEELSSLKIASNDKRSNQNIAFLPPLTNQLLKNENSKFANKGKDCPRFGNRAWHLSIIPEVGYALPMKSLVLNDSDFQDIYDERVQNETSIEGIHASLAFQFKSHVTGLYIKPGVSYARFTERLDFSRTATKIDTTIGIISTTISQTGDTLTEIRGEIYEEIEITSKERVHYELHHFDLPIAIGYSFVVDKFTIDLEGGIKFNFLQKTSGNILHAEKEYLALDKNQQQFKNSFGLGFFGGLLLKRQISSHTEFYIAPRFTFNTLAVSSNKNPINQKYNVLGLHVGCIYAIY